MEQKKTLWIIAAVGAFLLVVLGAAGILYSPAKNLTPTVTTVATTQNQNSGWTNSTPSTTTPAQTVNQNTVPSSTNVGEMIVVSDNTTVYGLDQQTVTPPATKPNETTIDLNALKNELHAQTPVQPQNINITVNVPETEKKGEVTQNTTTTVQNVIPDSISTPQVEESAKIPKIIKKVEKATEEPKATSNVTKKESKAATSKPSTKAKTETKKNAPKPIEQYWVQVASYSNKKAAENARSILDSNKITSDIFTYEDSKDNVFFRVRVGPYMTESEAEYWKARILKIPYFAKNDAYITKTTK